jgi:hypothetical protein
MRCKYDCLGNEPAVTCDCLGRVVTADAGAMPAVVAFASLELRPGLIEIDSAGTPPPTPVFQPRSVQVVLSVPASGTDGGAPPVPAVHVSAGKLLQVRCVGGDFVKDCDVAGLAWTPVGGQLTARATFEVQSFAEPVDAYVASLKSWTVSVSSDRIKSSPQTLVVRYAALNNTSPLDQWSANANVGGGWKGTGRIEYPDGSEMILPLRALGDDQAGLLTLFDSSRTLSESGIVKLHNDRSLARTFWYVPAGKITSGQVVQETGLIDVILQSPQGDALRGTFGTLTTSIPRTGHAVTFTLRRDVEAATCSITGCADFETCSEGFCTFGPAYAEVPATGNQTAFVNALYDKWVPPSLRAALDAFPGRTPDGAFKNSWHLPCSGRLRSGNGIEIGVLSGNILSVSGESGCITGATVNGFPSAVNLEFIGDHRREGDRAPLPGDTMLRDCLHQISDLNAGDFRAGSFEEQIPLDYFREQNSCLSNGAFLATLYASQRPFESGRHYLWLLAQWTRLHTFIARQATEQAGLDTVLLAAREVTSGDRSVATSLTRPDLEEMLGVMEDGWGLVLTQENAGPSGGKLANMSGFLLVDPDYRKDVLLGGMTPLNPPPSPDHEQPAGLAPPLLEGLAAHYRLVEAYLRRVDKTTYARSGNGALAATRARALGRYGSALRLGQVVRQMAESIHGLALGACFQSGCTALPWEQRWLQARSEFLAARQSLVEFAANMVAMVNPLGIPEDDIPLFFGDVSGDNSRFFASSDYLLNAWAIPAVATAQADLQQAQQAWISGRNSVLQDDLLAADRERRLEAIAQQFGQVVIEGCGLAETAVGGIDPIVALQSFTADGNGLSPGTCFVDRGVRCAGAATPNALRTNLFERADPQAILYRLCLWHELLGYLRVPGDVSTCANATPQINADTLVCDGVTIDKALIWNDYGMSDVDPVAVHSAENRCQEALGHHPLPVPALPATCYRGRAGEALARLLSARAEIDAAVAHFDTTQAAFDAKQGQCNLAMELAGEQEAARETLNEVRAAWKRRRDDARSTSTFFGTLTGALGSWGGPSVSAGGVNIGIGGLVGGFLGRSRAGSEADKEAADDELRLAEAAYNDLLQRNSETKEIFACLSEAHTLKVSIDADLAVIKTRSADGLAAAVTLDAEIATISQAVSAGKAALARETGRTFEGYAFHYWLDDKMERYRRDFLWAQRLTYLAMRAIEYEFQQSSSLRPTILSAQHPDQLEDALLVLKQDQASRSINRRRPEELSVVLSLRDDVLRIADRSGAPAGERDWTPAERFRGRLSHPHFGVYDAAGRLMGQGIRFSLDPTAGKGQAGVALTQRCAERLWRVTATVQGDGLSTREPGAAVLLLKRNTFASQWCAGLTDGSVGQEASIWPSHNLFKPDETSASVGDAKAYTTAAIYPWFNIRRSEFYRVDYQQGASEELAGRGLYGDYILLFPRELLSGGFDLDRVEDVLLRFDYLSVDNLPSISE